MVKFPTRDYLSRYELFWPTENYTFNNNHVTEIFTITLVRCGLGLLRSFCHQTSGQKNKSVLSSWSFFVVGHAEGILQIQ